jgi:hypothetical protein
MTDFRRVIIESPFRAPSRRLARQNISYSLASMRDSINRGEAPFLSHRLYPGALDDNILIERLLGIDLGYAWWPAAEAICFYCDLGWSSGMLDAKMRAKTQGKKIEERYLAKDRHQDH